LRLAAEAADQPAPPGFRDVVQSLTETAYPGRLPGPGRRSFWSGSRP
jgi:hypothetical protein